MSGYRHSATGRRVLESLVTVVCPPEAHGLAAAIVDHMELTLAASPPMLGRAFATGLVAYDLGALPLHGRRAHKLSAERRERYFASWEHGPTPLHTQFAHAINQLMSLSCYEMPAMTERLGYHPAPWIDEVTRRRLTVYRDDVRRQEAQILAPDPLRPGVYVGKRRREVG
ncbi:MAG: hypothetical protein KIT31_18115 [Deltaproteobacteria bacterium]|nr:hypothetical protein [Deltaproteobacteria bacterium]